MPLVSNIKSHDTTFEYSTPAGTWKWRTRLDVSRSSPVYSVLDIVSPYGLLRDSIPLPGEVVQAMSDSIEELKANYAPSILVGPPTSVSITADEGRGASDRVTVQLTNGGSYGSILGCTLTPSASWMKVTPAGVGGLALNESGQFQVEVDSTTLVSSESPYAATVTIQDPNATNTPVTLPVAVVVRPKAKIQTVPTVRVFTVAKPLSGAFPSIPSQSFLVANVGPSGSSLTFEIQKLIGSSDWLTSFQPTTSTLASGADTSIAVTVAPPSNMLPGTYSEVLRVSGYSSNSYVDVQIQLVIT